MVSRQNREQRKQNLVWVDLEMTGLDPKRHVILEIATIVTDPDLNIVAHGPELAIKPSPAKLKAMDPWSRKTHTGSGLLDRVTAEGVPLADAERETLAFLKKHCVAGCSPLCGNSVWQDKRFIHAFMPKVEEFLHYRIVDVSSIKILVAHWFGGRVAAPKGLGSHRALADIEESIAELRYYRDHAFAKP